MNLGRLNIYNPGNIRHSNDMFQGEVQPSADAAFKQFSSMVYGYRAMFKILNTYINKHGINTISGIVSRWAPPHENDTNNYIAFVAAKTGVPAFAPISMGDKDSMTKLVYAISWYENGQFPDMNEISKGYDMATGFISQISELVPDRLIHKFGYQPLFVFLGVASFFGGSIFLFRKLRRR